MGNALNQRVGILSALALFMGLFASAVLTNSNVFAWIAFTIFAYGVWVNARSRQNTGTIGSFIDGFAYSAAVLIVARLFAWFASLLVFNESRFARGVDYRLFEGDASDMARILLDGGFNQSLLALTVLSVLAALATVAISWLRRGQYFISEVDNNYVEAYEKVPLATVGLALIIIISVGLLSSSTTVEGRLADFYEEAYVVQADTDVTLRYSEIEAAIDARTRSNTPTVDVEF